MSYHIYQTEGFILSSVSVSEASRYISIFTEDLGLVRGLAQGVRNLRSKLKYSLQDLSYSKVSFVRGKEVWRIVNAEKLLLIDNSLADSEKKIFLAKIATLLKRFLGAGERDVNLFNEIKRGFSFLNKETICNENLRKFELVFVLKILNHLGYGPYEKEFEEMITFSDWDQAKFDMINKNGEQKILEVINRAISHSHL